MLAQRAALGGQYARLFGALTDERADRLTKEEAQRIEAAMTVLRCKRTLPAEARVSLLWGAGIASTGGIKTTDEQALAFAVRPEFTVRMECDRVNADAPCLPMMPIRIQFSAQVPVASAREITLTDSTGRKYPALGLDELEEAMPDAGVGKTPPERERVAIKIGDTVIIESGSSPLTDGLSFGGPFPERGKLIVKLGDKLVDDVGRRPANLDRFPLEIPLDDYPPLIKFSGEFGILEATTGGVLPVTVRNVERVVSGRRAGMAPNRGIAGESKRIDVDADIADWMRRVDTAAEWRGEWERSEKKDEPAHWRERTGSTSVFKDDDVTEPFTVPRITSDRGSRSSGSAPSPLLRRRARARSSAPRCSASRTRHVARRPRS